MLPVPDDLPELDSVEVTEPLEIQSNHAYNTSSGHECSCENAPKVTAFLKRNVFVLLTMAAVASGKWANCAQLSYYSLPNIDCYYDNNLL